MKARALTSVGIAAVALASATALAQTLPNRPIGTLTPRLPEGGIPADAIIQARLSKLERQAAVHDKTIQAQAGIIRSQATTIDALTASLAKLRVEYASHRHMVYVGETYKLSRLQTSPGAAKIVLSSSGGQAQDIELYARYKTPNTGAPVQNVD